MNSNIVVIRNNDKVALYNRETSKIIRIAADVYEIIKDAKNTKDILQIAKEYSDDDREYFNTLANEMESGLYFKEFEQNRGLTKITFAITDNCNLFCSHCCYSAKYNKTNDIRGNINVLRKIIEINPKMITLTGGEPMLVNNFNQVLDILERDYAGIVTLATNATMINKNNVRRLCDIFEQFDISLDGYDEESTDKIRGKGSFKQVINSVKILKNVTDKRIVLSMAVDNTTYQNEEKFKALCRELDVEPMIRIMNMIGRAKKNHSDSNMVCDFMDGDINNISCVYDCKGGVDELFIDDKGDIYPCSNFHERRFLIGNILKDDWQEKLSWNKNYKWFENFSEYIPDTRCECSECDIKTFCWNCPALAKSFIDNYDIKKLSSICKQKYDGIKEALWN